MNADAARRAHIQDLLSPDLVDPNWLAGVADDLDIPVLKLWYAIAFEGDQTGFTDLERAHLFGYGQRWRREVRERKPPTQPTSVKQGAAVLFDLRLGRLRFSITREEQTKCLTATT